MSDLGDAKGGLGEAKGGLGDTEACAGDMRDARGPVGAPRSASLDGCDGDTGWINVGKAGTPAGDRGIEDGRFGCVIVSEREEPGPIGAPLCAERCSRDLTPWRRLFAVATSSFSSARGARGAAGGGLAS